jgi:perosamine synthetase
MVTTVLDPSFGLDKFAIMAEFDKRNIDSRPFFSRLSSLPAFSDRPGAKRFITPADRGAEISEYGVNLPSGYNMTEAQVDLVCAALREILGGLR